MVTLLAEVTRGNQVESIHTGSIAVTDREGTIVAQAGNPDQFAYFRSSAKPFQAISLIESGAADAFGFTPAELALCCASHQAERHHQDQVAAMLAKLGLTPEVLQCGCPLPSDDAQAGSVLSGQVLPSPLHCDCSGKHTGMIATCLHLGYPLDDYRSLEHPLQQSIRRNVSDVCMVDEDDLAIATDGCSVPTFGAPLRSFATAYAKLASALPTGTGEASHDAALARLAEAMIAHPENVAGDGNLVTELMRVGNGRIVAKSGAEGLICIGLRDQGLGIAIRIADGTFRAHPVVVSETLASLSAIDSESKDELLRRCPSDVHNHNGWLVGTIRPAFTMEQASA